MTEPFIDLEVVDTSAQSGTECPNGYDDEIISELWPGTTQMCDCLERKWEKAYYLDMSCYRTGKNAPHSSKDCFDVSAIPPVQ